MGFLSGEWWYWVEVEIFCGVRDDSSNGGLQVGFLVGFSGGLVVES